MKKMNNQNNPTAWMIRRDGVAIPCIQHIYGSENCIEETLYAAEWLYKNTLEEATRQTILDFIGAYGINLNKNRNAIRNLRIEIKNKPYVFLTRQFVDEIMDELTFEIRVGEEILSRKVCKKLNQEFMRARLGGMYHTQENCRDMYFRISSNDFDWTDVIKDFLHTHQKDIDTVTIVNDEESTGSSEFYHICPTGDLCTKIPMSTIFGSEKIVEENNRKT